MEFDPSSDSKNTSRQYLDYQQPRAQSFGAWSVELCFAGVWSHTVGRPGGKARTEDPRTVGNFHVLLVA